MKEDEQQSQGNMANGKGADLSILSRPTVSPDVLFRAGLLDLSRNSIYLACENGQIESFRVGRRILIPTAALRRKLGIEAA